MLSEDEDDYEDEDDDDDDVDDIDVVCLFPAPFSLASLMNSVQDSDEDDLPPPRRGATRGAGRGGRGGPPANVNREECKQQ
jgi:hypothetical protein